MKKICYVVTVPITVRSFFIPQLKYLSNHGFKVSVICSHDCELQDDLGENIKFIPINIPRGFSFIGMIKAIISLCSVFKKERFDLVQYSTPNAAFCASIAARVVGIKIRNYHLMGFRYLGNTGILKVILKSLEKITCLNSTHIECVSKSNLEFGVLEKLFPKEKVTVVWNGSSGGVDLERFDISKKSIWRSQVRKELEIDDDELVFAFVGRITKDKGINELLEAFFDFDLKSKLLLIGNEEAINTINQNLWQKAVSSENIIMVNQVDDIERYYSAIDVLLLPSYREGFGNVIIEAGAMGVPSIVSNIPGPIDAVVENKTGLFCECKNSLSLLNAMKKIVDKDNYKFMSQKVCDFVSNNFDSAILCEKIFKKKNVYLEYSHE